ncbi:hypothetical protein TraAM80_02542 [Trypanosoma rangeli]|uniref:DUF4456 domain-containing protein n=1 Tax=Trypanosoma rangeli TaxID=5698 RepID=A0A422NTN2_TRYRA|nr:uncharacterized protein TraAM80_02542 [Trypanosoma rangeli]RNF08800.1 hypothetical protein TraAM80_02542 [Trypanosoma rangeli]|eukprot:RNF08800.1 hypothetical protein TraAM80_02542 [Trypanosoma rangeli]
MGSPKRAAAKESRLQLRMAARYQNALVTFHDGVREFNKQLDEEQMLRLVNLKEFLQRSHNECTAALQAETNRVEAHKNLLAQPAVCDAEELMQPFTDDYHEVEVRIDDSKARLEAERQRLLSLCVEMRQSYQSRVDAITSCEENMETREKERREGLKKSLVEFVEALTKISYTSIGASHVLAQRAIHEINEHLCKNHTSRETLLAQLRCREILLQRQYSRQLADVYGTSLELMMRSCIRWATTLLQTAHFCRPQCRMRAVEQTGRLVSSIRRDGTQFLGNMATTVQSLRRAREPLQTECGQICGGTLPDGWLRSFNGGLFSPVFPVSPSEVTVEWRVKANVLVRNILVQCATAVEDVRIAEQELCAEAELLLSELHTLARWICEPEAKETELLAQASLYGVDEVYSRFTCANSALQAQFSAEVDAGVLPLLTIIRRESQWFTTKVETELNSQHAALESVLLTGPINVLFTFEKATDALEETATNALGFIRSGFIALHEARKDHDDNLRHVEMELARKQEELQHAPTMETAEVLFVECLAVLERIAAQHVDFKHHTVQSLQRVAQDGKMEVEQHCAKLLLLFGLESEEACLQREREAATTATTTTTTTTKRGRAKEVVVEPDTLSDLDSVPSYPTITAVDGQMYYVVGPIALGDRPPTTSAGASPSSPSQQPPHQLQRKRSFGGEGGRNRLMPIGKRRPPLPQSQRSSKKVKGGAAQSESSGTSPRLSPVPVVLPPPAFLDTYESLLRPTLQGDNEATASLSSATVEEWREMLRVEVLNWTVQLRHISVEHVQKQCNAQRSAIDAETNKILRYHRRRPATVQSEYYEGRIREIETTQMKKENHCNRLLEHFTVLENVWSSIGGGDQAEAHDTQLFEQLQELEKLAPKANTTNALILQERNFASLASTSLEAHSNRYHKIMADVAKQKELLESKCRNYLLSCGKGVPESFDKLEDTSAWDDPNDSSCKQVIEVLLRLHNTAKALKEKLSSERDQHVQHLDAAKSSYAVVFEQNLEELQLLERVQEVLSRLKVQVHSLMTLSETSEAKIEETLKELEEKLSSSPLSYDFSNALAKVAGWVYGGAGATAESLTLPPAGGPSSSPTLSMESIARGPGGTAVTLTEDSIREVEAELSERLAEVKTDIERQIRASDMSKVLRILDHIREMVYVRGRQLDCLQYGMEFFNVPQENYIDPRLGAKAEAAGEDAATAAAGAGTEIATTSALSKQGRVRGRSRLSISPNSVLAALYTTNEPPEVISAERQVKNWLATARSQVEHTAEQHFSVCPSPVVRRLPGMTGGSLQDVMEMCDSVCDQQQRRVMQHVVQATRRYREQVDRLFVALQNMPRYLVNGTCALSFMALERRVATVFDVFASFYGESDAIRAMHDRLVKVTLASNYNHSKLNELCKAESLRQTVAQATIEKLWGYTLREIEDEAAMHAARSLNVDNNFFAFLRGVVMPESLKPAVDDEGSGRHRGLRGLLRLKAKEDRGKEAQQQQQSSMRRERRLRETMTHRSSSGTLLGGKRAESASPVEMASGQLPTPAPLEVEHGSVPLHALRPLESFNAGHPSATINLPNSDLTPTFARVSLATRLQTPPANRRQKKDVFGPPVADERGPVVTIVAPETSLHMKIAKLTQQSVQYFNTTSSNVVDRANDAFQGWTEQEARWRETWGASIKRLKG